MSAIQGIKGFLGTSLLDYPGKVAAVVFLSGCNLRCPFCHNHILVQEDAQLEDLRLKELIDGIHRRRKLIEGIVVTGGEPTAHPQLAWLLCELRDTGLAIKLDTNGLRPDVLEHVLQARLVDYVAVDMKIDPLRYESQLAGPADSALRLRQTVTRLRESPVDHEFRTTCAPGLVQDTDIAAIGKFIAGAPAYYLQQYYPNHVLDPGLSDRPPYPREVLERFMEIARPHVKHVDLRNI